MRRALKALPVAVLMLVGLALLFRKDVEGERHPEPAPLPPAASSAPAVRIEHTMVTADVVTSPAVSPRRAPTWSPGAATPERRVVASAPAVAVRTQAASSLAARTRRVIVGDGRHKPQPFPRINNN